MAQDQGHLELVRVTVSEVLILPAMEGARVVAGNRGLSDPVDAAGVLDVIDLDSLKRNQFVLSSVYPLRHIDLGRFLPTLCDRGAVALGLMLSGYWRDVPHGLLDAADQLGLPLLVPPERAFDDRVTPSWRRSRAVRRSGCAGLPNSTRRSHVRGPGRARRAGSGG